MKSTGKFFSKAAIPLLAMLGISFAGQAEMRVTPLDCLTMINPLNGNSIKGLGCEEGKDWIKSNPVWDGKEIRMKGAKDERLTLQLVFTWDAGDSLEDIKIELDLPCAENPSPWRSWCIWNAPEVAVPIGGGNGSFDIPTKMNIEKELFEKNKYCAWSAGIDFSVSKQAKTGKCSGKVLVSGKDFKQSFPLQFDVYPFSMPPRPSYIIEMNSYGDYTKYYPETLKAYLDIHKTMREHKCTFVQIPYLQGGSIKCPFLAPNISFDKSSNAKVDWASFDSAIGGLFDGSLFPDGQPVSHFILPFCYNWPVPFNEYNKNMESYKAKNVSARKAFVEHATAKKWDKTIFQEFHNENPSGGAGCPWHLDEPRSARDMEGHALYTSLFHSAMGKKKTSLFHYRIDISDWRRLGDSLKPFHSQINDWIVSRDPKFLDDKATTFFKGLAESNNGLFIEYGEIHPFTNNNKPNNWSQFGEYHKKCFKAELDGYEQWIIDTWKEKSVHGTAGPLFFAAAGGARDMIWPGHAFGVDRPLPSLRLKAIRESQNLFDYVRLASMKKGNLDAIDKAMSKFSPETSQSHFEIKTDMAKLLGR